MINFSKFNSLYSVATYFNTEEKCQQAIVESRWGDDVVIGIGCICESHISYGVYELFWGMLDAEYRGNGWGKILVESRLEWVAKHNKGLSSPNDVIVVTKSPWHLTRCGFEILKQLNSDGEVLMYRKLNNITVY